MANPKRDNEKAARALADAHLHDDRTACEIHKITDRTLRRWREALKSDPELSALFRLYCQQAAATDWAKEIDSALASTTRKLQELVEAAQTPDPETIEAVTGAVATLAEVAMTRDVLRAQLEPEQPTLHAEEDDPAHYVN